MARNTWRFNFIDVNNSVTQTEAEDAEIIGYMPVRASKGNTEAFYFKPGSKSEIEAMLGAGNADYPDITEAIEFNKKYGLYVSAPPGGTLAKPSTYGGLYITNKGLFNFYKVTDKENPGFIGLIDSAKANGVNGDTLSGLSLEINKKEDESDVLSISGITPALKNILQGVVLTFDGESKELLFFEDNASMVFKNGTVKEGSLSLDSQTGKYIATFDVGKVSKTKKLRGMYAIPADENIFRESEAENSSLRPDEARPSESTIFDQNDKFIEAYLTGAKYTNLWLKSKNRYVTYSNNNLPKIEFLVNIANDAYQYIVQKSPTSNVTNITINSIGYDKYLSDDKMYFVEKDTIDNDDKLGLKNALNGATFISKNNPATATVYSRVSRFIDTNIDRFNKQCVMVYDSATQLLNIYKLAKVNEQDANGFLCERIYFTLNNNAFSGRKIKICGTLTPSVVGDAYGIENKIYIPLRGIDADDNEDCSIYEMTADPVDGDTRKKLSLNPDYNTLSFTQTEEINGDLKSCGTFKGSCDPLKLDEYQAPLAWNEVLPNDSVSFVEVYPIKTFDADLDDGSFTGTRIEPGKYEISGYRYVSDIVAENKAAGFTGGSMDNVGTPDNLGASKKFSAIIQAGLTEAAKPIYEEVAVFIEPTGDKQAKQQLVSLRETKKFSTMASPRLITNAEFRDTQSIIVSDRHRGGIQYVGEFLVKDANGQTYWSTLIGSVGSLLAQNDAENLGGKPPAWVNDKNFGGQIDREVIKARWDFEDEDTKILDQKGLNPIILDAEYGVMITSQKTTELNAGDWSKIAHQMSFDLCKRHIKDKVMVPLLMKRINEYWMRFAKEGLKKILDKRLEGDDPIWAEAVPYVNSVNTTQTKDESNFMLKVVVKVNPVAEKVTLTFENTAQGTEIREE